MSFNIGVSLEGSEKIAALLSDLEKRAVNLTPAMKSIGSHVVSVALMSFRKEQTPWGAAWPKSGRAKKKKGKTLADTGRLKASISRDVNANGVRISTGSNVRYAAIHQFGFSGPVIIKSHIRKITKAFGKPLANTRWADIKAHSRKMFMVDRPYMPMTLEEIGISDIEEILIKHLTKAGG